MDEPEHANRLFKLGCVVPTCNHRSPKIHHIICKPFGGKITKDDRYLAPLCEFHHVDGKMGYHGVMAVENNTPFRICANERFRILYDIDLYAWAHEQWLISKEEFGR